MRKLLVLLVLLPGGILGSLAGFAADTNIVVTGAWLREPPPGMDMAGIYLTVHNAGVKPLRLIGASSTLARSATLHESMQSGGMSHMMPLKALDLPPSASIEFKPGGRHIMLQGLQHPLHTGDRVPLVLRFADGAQVAVTALVAAPNATPNTTH